MCHKCCNHLKKKKETPWMQHEPLRVAQTSACESCWSQFNLTCKLCGCSLLAVSVMFWVKLSLGYTSNGYHMSFTFLPVKCFDNPHRQTISNVQPMSNFFLHYRQSNLHEIVSLTLFFVTLVTFSSPFFQFLIKEDDKSPFHTVQLHSIMVHYDGELPK